MLLISVKLTIQGYRSRIKKTKGRLIVELMIILLQVIIIGFIPIFNFVFLVTIVFNTNSIEEKIIADKDTYNIHEKGNKNEV